MELIIIVVIAFLIGKAFGKKKSKRPESWEEEEIYLPEKKKPGCLFRFAKLVLFLVVAFFVLIFFEISGEELSSSSVAPSATVTATKAPTEAPAAIPTSTPTIEPTATPAPQTREEWVQRAAQEVYGSDLISVSFQPVDNQKDMIVIWHKFADNFTNNLRRTNFMNDAGRMFKRVADLGKAGYIDYGSCYIVGRTTFLDVYNNEFDGNAMEIRLLASDLEKMNWDRFVSEDQLITLATTYAVHPLFRD